MSGLCSPRINESPWNEWAAPHAPHPNQWYPATWHRPIASIKTAPRQAGNPGRIPLKNCTEPRSTQCSRICKINVNLFFRTKLCECSFGEEIVITPRNFEFNSDGFQEHKGKHYATIGVAHVVVGFPLYYDAVNEKRLDMAGLNFVGNARYTSCCNADKGIYYYTAFENHQITVVDMTKKPWRKTSCHLSSDYKTADKYAKSGSLVLMIYKRKRHLAALNRHQDK